ncbi:neuromedin-B receptor [Biomphalaria glabrata]|nr:neuromedin-B receptor [Biomphalaria glabrata]
MSVALTVAVAVVSAVANTYDLYPGGRNHSGVEMGLENVSTSTVPGKELENITYFNKWEISTSLEGILVPIVFVITFIVGLVGNGTLIVSVIANKVMCNIPNIFIVSLSIGDFLLILVSVPVTSFYYTFKNWPFGEAMCKINEVTQTISLGVSVFTLTALSADRYVAIVNPMAKLTGRTLRTTIVTVVVIWLLSTLLALPDAIFGKETRYEINGTVILICHQFEPLDHDHGKIFFMLRFVIFFLLPIITIGFFYINMARILIRSSSNVPVDSKTGAVNHNRQMIARRKVAHVVLSFVIIFIICWLPRHIYLILWNYMNHEYDEFWHVLKILTFCLTFINSCVNPFALYFLSGQFRKYYNRYLFCCCQRVRYDSLEPTSTMHNLHSTSRRQSLTNTSIVHSQSMC